MSAAGRTGVPHFTPIVDVIEARTRPALPDPAARLSASGWRLVLEDPAPDPRLQVAVDDQLFQSVAGNRAPPTVRVWRSRQCVVVPRAERRLREFQRACVVGQQSGWPVVLRSSGGAAFPIGSQTVQVSLIYRSGAGSEASIAAAYSRLCEPFLWELGSRGVDCALQGTPASMCDGPYNLCIGGRKLAGTAQRQRLRQDGIRVVLNHLSMQTHGGITDPMAALERYYTMAGAPRTFDPSVHTTLADCLDQDGQHRPDLAGPAVTEWIAVVLARYLRPPPDSSHWSGPEALNGNHELTDIPLNLTMEGARP